MFSLGNVVDMLVAKQQQDGQLSVTPLAPLTSFPALPVTLKSTSAEAATDSAKIVSTQQPSASLNTAVAAGATHTMRASHESDHLMTEDMPDEVPEVSGDESSTDDLDAVLAAQEKERAEERRRKREDGMNVSGFAFKGRPQPPVPNPANPQNFRPSLSNPKPTCIVPKQRVVRYFQSPYAPPTSAAELEKAIHKALITMPSMTQSLNTTVPSEFAQTSAGDEALTVTPLGSLLPRSKSYLNATASGVPRASPRPLAPVKSSAFLTEVASFRRSQSPDCRTPSASPPGGRNDHEEGSVRRKSRQRFSISLAAKIRRKASRKRSMVELKSQLDELEFEVFDDAPVGTTTVSTEDELSNTQQCDANTEASVSDYPEEAGLHLSSSMRKRKFRKRLATYSRSLYNTSLPEFGEDGMLQVSMYPQALSVEALLEKVSALESGSIVSRLMIPHVQEFLRSPECTQIMLAFFWHSVVSIRRVKMENELLRVHKAFEDAFHEVNPRSTVVHPTVEEAEALLSTTHRLVHRESIVDANGDANSCSTLGFSALYMDQMSPRSAEEDAASLSFHDAAAHPVVHRARLEMLTISIDDLIVARGELEDAVLFEEMSFKAMALAFGRSFRGAPSTSKKAAADFSHNATFPLERKEAIFGIFPTVAAHATYYALVKTFPNDYDACLFNRKFRRSLLQRITYWCSGITLQHVAVGNWPTPIDDEAAHIANVLVSTENVANGQYAVMKEFHKRANHSATVFTEWLRQQEGGAGAAAVTTTGATSKHQQTSAATEGLSQQPASRPTVASNVPTLPQISNGSLASPPSKQQLTHSARTPGTSHVASPPPASVTARHVKGLASSRLQPTLQSSSKAWYEHGAVRGQLTAERTFEYGFSGASSDARAPTGSRAERLLLAGAAASFVPMPHPDAPIVSIAGGATTSSQRFVQVPATSPFMTAYAKAALSLDLKVVDLAGREAPPMRFTQLSTLDKFSVHLAFGTLASPRVAKAEKALDDVRRADVHHNALAHQLDQESAHFRKQEETRLQYAERVIDYHLSPRNPEYARDARQCEKLLREALKAPSIMTAHSTAQCQHALRCYRDMMFTSSERRHVLHELSIRVACKIRHMQRLRGDIWGDNERTIPSGGKKGGASSSGANNRYGDVDVTTIDFDASVVHNEFPLVGTKLDEIAGQIVLHEWREGHNAYRLMEESEFSELMSEFVRRHQRILVRDRSRFPLMRPAYLPFPVKDSIASASDMSAEDKWRAEMIRSNNAAATAGSLLTRRYSTAHEAAQVMKSKVVFDPSRPDEGNIFTRARRDDEMLHVEQLRQRLESEYGEQHDGLQAELDAFVSATAIGRRGKLVTPPDASESGGGLSFADAAGQPFLSLGHPSVPTQRRHSSLVGVPSIYQASDRNAFHPSPTPLDAATLLRQVATVTPKTKVRPPQHRRSQEGVAATSPLSTRQARQSVLLNSANLGNSGLQEEPLLLPLIMEEPASTVEDREDILSSTSGGDAQMSAMLAAKMGSTGPKHRVSILSLTGIAPPSRGPGATRPSAPEAPSTHLLVADRSSGASNSIPKSPRIPSHPPERGRP